MTIICFNMKKIIKIPNNIIKQVINIKIVSNLIKTYQSNNKILIHNNLVSLFTKIKIQIQY